jgi:hypothetical protein
MLPFHDIESLRHVIADVDRHCDYNGLTTKPTIKFRGTVKLHGTNAGVRVTGYDVIAQGRNRVLTIQSDNFGFALFTAQRSADFRSLRDSMFGTDSADVTFFGEWCGVGIQKGVGIAKLPKMFVIFAIHHHADDTWYDFGRLNLGADDYTWFNNQNIYFITQFPTYSVEVDFNNPTPAAEEIGRLTLLVEDSCPVANSSLFTAYNHGENIGIGEGIVWVSVDYPVHITFKSKGLKHKKASTTPRVATDPAKVDSINALVDELLPEWRLEQGFDHLRQNNLPIVTQSTGDYLKWISQDILKEETDVITANAFPWKEIVGTISRRARDYYLKKLDENAGLSMASEG